MNRTLILVMLSTLMWTGCSATAKELATERQFRQQCDEELAAAKEQLEAVKGAQKRAKVRLDAYQDIADRFRKLFPALDIDMEIRNGRMVIKMPNEVFFDTGSTAVSEEGQAALARVGRLLKSTERTIIVGGHTDNVPVAQKVGGEYSTNWELSTLRALNVVYYLQEKGMPADKMIAAGFGEHQPTANNGTESGRRLNRRIELILLPQINEIPKFPDEL